jgi:hypothetical protein
VGSFRDVLAIRAAEEVQVGGPPCLVRPTGRGPPLLGAGLATPGCRGYGSATKNNRLRDYLRVTEQTAMPEPRRRPAPGAGPGRSDRLTVFPGETAVAGVMHEQQRHRHVAGELRYAQVRQIHAETLT